MTKFSFNTILASSTGLERILDNLAEGIIAHDFKRRIFFINREAERITGFSRKEVLGKDCHLAFGRPFCGEYCTFCGNHKEWQGGSESTLNITTKSGKIKRIEMSISSIQDENGSDVGILSSFTDITDLMQLQLRAKKLVSFSNIIGQDAKMLDIFKQIRDVAAYDYPVHISGETGTGKELVAAAIHNESLRNDAPFVPINCGALPEGLIESELFGHVKGAFSGAIRDKKGRFELASGGTIFLDEVAELSKSIQVKLLRFLQEGAFELVGGEKTVSVDVKITSATNKDLKKEVQKNNFREDLYYRLNVIPIHLPPLRKRKTDIPLLIDHFLKEAAAQYHKQRLKISKDALAAIMDYNWPGNVRELQNALQFAIVKCVGQVIRINDLPMELAPNVCRCTRRGPGPKLNLQSVQNALKIAGGNKSNAAKSLGVARATLYRFLNTQPDLLANQK